MIPAFAEENQLEKNFSMKIALKNLGPIKQAEIELGDLSIICGKNNTGKTYAAYAIFGYLYTWQRILSIEIDDNQIDELLNKGFIILDIHNYFERAQEIVNKSCEAYIKELPKIFASSNERFQESDFQVCINTENINLNIPFQRPIRLANSELLSIDKAENSTELTISLLAKDLRIPHQLFRLVLKDVIQDLIFAPIFPNVFIASAERTGAAIFRKELNFARNRLLEEIGQDSNLDPVEFLLNSKDDYALPIRTNVEFTRDLEKIVKNTSFIAQKYPNILDDFADIIGGEYSVTRNDELYFVPKDRSRIKLSLDESSSAVRSLLDIGFYLKHEARAGDMLIVDEPELNLHPENQRKVARLLARLVNMGIKVFITTHSDYIIKEFNTLIMLNQNEIYLKQIAEKEGYLKEELLSPDKIKVYIAEKNLVKVDGNLKRTKVQTLTQASIDPSYGIELPTFDETIDEMNRIQEEIVWGKE